MDGQAPERDGTQAAAQQQQDNSQQQAAPKPQTRATATTTPAAATALLSVECADVPISATQLQLAKMAEVIVTGVVLAAGAGTGHCAANGTLTPHPDDPAAIASGAADPSGSSFIVVGLQCVHQGLVRCRSNSEDAGDCLLLVEAPVLSDSAPCALTGGQRYMFFLQAQPGPCDGYYYAMFQRAYHTIRRPLGGTGCAFYPGFPDANDMITRINGQCADDAVATCEVDRCAPTITRSPCANDTATSCDLKMCPGKFMYYNAIMPSETCYELYTYRTSGLPVNCYGQRYINNRIQQIELQQALANATANATAAAALQKQQMQQDSGEDGN